MKRRTLLILFAVVFGLFWVSALVSVWVSHSSSATATLTTAASNRGDSEGKAGGIHEKFANNLRKAVPPGRDEAAQRPSATTVHPSRAERAKTHDMAWDAEASHGKNAELLAKAETEIQELQAQIESMEADLQVWKEKALELEEQQQQQPKGPLAASTALSSTADVWVLPPSTTNEIPHATLATATAAGVYRPPRDHNGILPPAMMPSHWNLYSPLKRLITAWRGALVDWHFLVPSLGAGFEGNGPCCGKGRFERLVANEAAVAAMLMDAKATTALGPIANDMYNPDYRYCPKLNDMCLIHRNEDECNNDGFCFWCESSQLCTGRAVPKSPSIEENSVFHSLCGKAPGELPPPPLIRRVFPTDQNSAMKEGNSLFYFSGNPQTIGTFRGEQAVQPLSSCKMWIAGTTYVLSFQQERMYWHFVNDNLKGIVKKMNGALGPDDVHILLQHDFDESCFGWFSILGKSCYRTLADVPDGTCFENIITPSNEQAGAPLGDWVRLVLHRLELTNWPTTENRRPLIGLVTRHDKRFITNTEELVNAAAQLGYDTVEITYEDLSADQQVAVSRRVDVLVGIHGSNLMNMMFMRRGKAVIQITPWKLVGRHIEQVYKGLAGGYGLHYFQLEVDNYDDTVTHWHFVQRDIDQGLYSRESIQERGAAAVVSEQVARVVLIQQDTRVPVEGYTKVISEAVKNIGMA